ncbi:MAG: Serine/threonine-protein kinase PknD [Myxococcota bacterium]|nr:Serine/threonine-protein kinase PknD [Myxococcota bacterium]
MTTTLANRDSITFGGGRYQVIEEVGQGGMASVYRAHDATLGREVAIKVMHKHLASREEFRERFRREAQAVARLDHPNIPRIFDYSPSGEGGEFYLVTEFVHGLTLAAEIHARPLPQPELAAAIMIPVLRALDHAHGAGIVHRDLKPENIMLSPGGAVKLMDFGIAQIVNSQKMTMTGSLVGSAGYMSPELIHGQRGDHRSDLFAAGSLLYMLAAGVHPFEAGNAMATMKRIADGVYEPAHLTSGQIDHQLSAIISALLAPDPESRPASAAQAAAMLESWLRDSGLKPDGPWLSDYLGDPRSGTEKLRAALTTGLLKSARELSARGRLTEALDGLNRILAFDPDHAEARALMGALNRQRQSETGAPNRKQIWTAAMVLTGLAGAVILWWGSSSPSPQPPAPAASLSPPEEPASRVPPPPAVEAPASPSAMMEPVPVDPSPAKTALTPPAAPPRIRPEPRKAAAAPAAAPEDTAGPLEPETATRLPMTIRVLDAYASLSVDGQDAGTGALPVHRLMLTPGKHRIELRHPNFELFSREVLIPNDPAFVIPTLDARLTPLPARIRVNAAPGQNPMISIDGRPFGAAASSLKLPFLLPMTSGRKPITLRIEQVGFAPREISREVIAGELVEVDARLEKLDSPE